MASYVPAAINAASPCWRKVSDTIVCTERSADLYYLFILHVKEQTCQVTSQDLREDVSVVVKPKVIVSEFK